MIRGGVSFPKYVLSVGAGVVVYRMPPSAVPFLRRNYCLDDLRDPEHYDVADGHLLKPFTVTVYDRYSVAYGEFAIRMNSRLRRMLDVRWYLLRVLYRTTDWIQGIGFWYTVKEILEDRMLRYIRRASYFDSRFLERLVRGVHLKEMSGVTVLFHEWCLGYVDRMPSEVVVCRRKKPYPWPKYIRYVEEKRQRWIDQMKLRRTMAFRRKARERYRRLKIDAENARRMSAHASHLRWLPRPVMLSVLVPGVRPDLCNY